MNTEIYVKVGDVSQLSGGTATGKITDKVTSISKVKVSDDTNYINTNNISRVEYGGIESPTYNDLIDTHKLREAFDGSTSPVIDYVDDSDMHNYIVFSNSSPVYNGVTLSNVVKLRYDDVVTASCSTGYDVSCISLGGTDVYIGSDKLVRYDSGLVIDGSFATVSTNGIINTIAYNYDDNSIIVGGSFSLVNGITVSNIFKCDSSGNVDTSIPSLNVGTNGEVMQISFKYTDTDPSITILGNFTEYNGLEENRIIYLDGSTYLKRSYTNTGFKTLDVTQDPNTIIFNKKCFVDDMLLKQTFIGISYVDMMLYNDAPIKKLLTIDFDDASILDSFENSDIIAFNHQSIDKLSILKNLSTDEHSDVYFNIYDSYNGNHFVRSQDNTIDIIYSNINPDSYYFISRIIYSTGLPLTTYIYDYILGNYDIWLGVETGVILNKTYSNNDLISIQENGDFSYVIGTMNATASVVDIKVDNINRKYVYNETPGTYNGVTVSQLYRILEDNTLDTSFDTSSLTLLNTFVDGSDYITLDPTDDDKIYVLSNNYTLLRLNSDGTNDTGFTASFTDVYKVLPLSTGKVLIGRKDTPNSKILLLNNNGSVDLSFNDIEVDTTMDNKEDRLHMNSTEDLFIFTGIFNNANSSTYNGIVTFDITGTLETTFFNMTLLAYNDNNYSVVNNDILYIYDRSITFPSPTNTYKFNPFGYLIKIDIYTSDYLGEVYDDNTFVKMDSLATSPKIWSKNNEFGLPRLYLEYKDLSTGKIMLSVLDSLGSTIVLNDSYSDGGYFVNNGSIIINGYNLVLSDYKNPYINRDGIDYQRATEDVSVTLSNITNVNITGLIKPTFNQGTGFNNIVSSAKLLSNGKIVCVGNFSTYNGVSANRIAFLNQDGSLDTASMTNVGVGFVNPCYKVIERMDTNKIVVVGGFSKYKNTNINRIIQLNLDGSIDTSITGITSGANGDIFDIKHDLANNKFYIGGRFTQYNGVSRNSLACLTSNLALNTGFAVGTGFSGGTAPSQVKAVYALEVQPDGKLLVGSNYTIYNGTTIQCLTRHNTNGTLDSTFQTNIGTGPVGVYSVVKAIKILTDNRIVVGGNFQNFNGNAVANMVRLSPIGIYDPSFNTNTIFNSIQTGGSGSFDVAEVETIALQPDGKMLVGGSFLTAPATVYFNKGIQRINVDGSLDSSYGRVDLQNSFVGISSFTNVKEIIFITYDSVIAVGRFDKYHYSPPTNNTSGGIQIVNKNIYQKLTLFKEEDILVNFILKDSNDLSKIFSTYTQSFQIPADDNNNMILNHYFNTELVRKSVVVLEAKIYIKKSLFKIGTIEIIQGDYEKNRLSSYSVTFSTGIGLLTRLMGTDKLADINVDNLSFTYNRDWVYEQIQNGTVGSDVQVPLISTDRVWSYNDGALFDIKPGSGKAITFKELKPAIRFDVIMKAVIDKYSLNIECPLFGRDEYRKMFIWLNSFTSDKKNKVVLPLGVYSNIGNSYFFTETNLIEDYYLIRIFNTNYNVNRVMNITAQLLGVRDNSTGDILSDKNITIFYVDKNTNENLAVITAKTNSIGTLKTEWFIPQPSVTKDYYIRFFSESNEVIRYDTFNIICKTNDTAPAVSPLNSALQGMYYEPRFPVASYLGDITVLDFFSSFFKMFNISVIEDNITNKMIFLTQDELHTNTLDYTSYIDIKSHNIKPQPNYKTYDFKYADSEYFRNYEFKKIVGLEYGELKYNRTEAGLVGEYLIESKFGIMNYFYMQSNMGALNVKTSYGFTGGEEKDENTQLYKPYRPKGLTLMYIEDKVPIKVGNVATSLNYSKSSGIVGLSNYIRFGNQEELNDAMNDNSLTFSVDVEEVYGPFTKNLFTNYYDSTIQRIVNGNTRTFTINAVLPTYEINRFSLRNIIIIGDRRFTIDSATVNIITGETKMVLTNIATSPIKYN